MSLLTAKQSAEYLGITLYEFRQEVKKGNIRFKPVGYRRKYRPEDLDLWRNNTQYLSDYTNVVKPTTHISPMSLVMDKGITLESLQNKYYPKKQRSSVLSTSRRLRIA
jgi:hypothetical protein